MKAVRYQLFGGNQFGIVHVRFLGPLVRARAFGMTPAKTNAKK